MSRRGFLESFGLICVPVVVIYVLYLCLIIFFIVFLFHPHNGKLWLGHGYGKLLANLENGEFVLKGVVLGYDVIHGDI